MTIAVSGMNAAATQLRAAASNLVRPNPDIATQMVAALEARLDFGASLAVFKAADRMTGTLLDRLA